MRSVKLSLEKQSVTAGSDLHGTITLNGVGPIDHVRLELVSGNNQILSVQLIENYVVGTGTYYIPFTIPVSVTVLPERIQYMRGCVVCQVKATVITKSSLLSRFRIQPKLHASHLCTVENRGLPTQGSGESMDSVGLTSTSQSSEIPAPKKEQISFTASDFTSVVPVQREPDVNCFTALMNTIFPRKSQSSPAQPKLPINLDQLQPPFKPLPEGMRWGYKTAFNVFVFPEFDAKLLQEKFNAYEVNHHNHVLSI